MHEALSSGSCDDPVRSRLPSTGKPWTRRCSRPEDQTVIAEHDAYIYMYIDRCRQPYPSKINTRLPSLPLLSAILSDECV